MVSNVKKLHSKRSGFVPFLVASQPGQGQKPVKCVSFKRLRSIPNPDTGKPYVSIYCAWHTARSKAGLADVRMHDLRYSFASLLINSGRTLYEVQHILGHTQVKTTQRYAHLSQDTLLAASNAATAAMGSVMGTMPNRVLDVPLVAALG